MDTNKDVRGKLTEAETVYVLNFAHFMRFFMSHAKTAPGNNMVYSPRCGTHAVSTSPLFSRMKSMAGISEADMVRAFLVQFTSQVEKLPNGRAIESSDGVVIDDCYGLFCNKYCA